MAEDTRSGATPPLVSGADIRTFLFADMRGYTRFTQEHGDDAASALAGRFADLVKETVPAFEGELLELRGDEALCVFRSARQALRASVELQRRLRTATDEEPAFPIGVGMGLDAGEAVPTHGGYRGASLNLAARLCALAKPGEILASGTVIGLASRVEGMRFLEGRSATLKGMARPVRYVVVEPEQPLPLPPSLEQAPLRRWPIAAGVGGVLLIGVIAGVAILSRSSGHAPVRLAPGSVSMIEGTVLKRHLAVSEQPSAMTLGGGAAWVAEPDAGRVVRINPGSGPGYGITVGRDPSALAYGGGTVWVVNAGDGTVSRISPVQDQVVGQPIEVGNGPAAIAYGNGAAWVANALDNAVVEITAQNDHVGRPIPLQSSPTALAVAFGSVWVASAQAGTVTRIDAHNGTPLQTIRVGSGPTAIAADGQRVWVANSLDGTVTSIDPSTNVATTKPVGGQPTSLAVGAGHVWVANADTSSVTEISSPDGSITDQLRVGAATGLVAAAGNQTWFATMASAASHRGGTLRVVTTEVAPPWIVDPVHIDSVGWPNARMTNDGLVGFRRVSGAAGYTLVPDLARSVPAPTDAGLAYTFQLRNGIRYSNGRPVTAMDVPWSLERMFESATYGPSFFSALRGASRCISQTPKPVHRCDLSPAITVEQSTGIVTFHLKRPDPSFLTKLALPFADIVPRGTPPDPAGTMVVPATGPYEARVSSTRLTVAGRELTLIRNPRFHQWSQAAQPSGYPDQIVWTAYTTHDQAPTTAVRLGQQDWTPDPAPPTDTTRLETRYAAQLHPTPTPQPFFMLLNTHQPPFSNRLVRRALNYAVDRGQAARIAGTLNATVTCQVLPPSFPDAHPACPYTLNPNPTGTWSAPDLARAGALVTRSGTRGDSVTLLATALGVSIPISRYFGHLLDTLGYHAHVRVVSDDPPSYKYDSLVASDRYQTIEYGWAADYPAAENTLGIFTCRLSPLNFTGSFCNHHYDKLVHAAESAEIRDPAAAATAWATAERYLADQAPMVPLYVLGSPGLASRRVGNYETNPWIGALIDEMWVK